LAPLERQDFAVDPPASEVGERRRRPNRFRKLRQHRQELITLEDPDADVVFLQKRDVRLLFTLDYSTLRASTGSTDAARRAGR
jgi:hypothetical protein